MVITDPQVGLLSWEDVEKQIGILSQKKAEKAKIVNQFVAKIAALNAAKDHKTNEVDFVIQQSESMINGFVMTHLNDFDKKKSKTFNTGKIKVREFEGLDYPPEKELLAALHHLGLEKLIEVSEKASKSAIKLAAKNDPELLAKLEIDVKDEVSVSIETY